MVCFFTFVFLTTLFLLFVLRFHLNTISPCKRLRVWMCSRDFVRSRNLHQLNIFSLHSGVWRFYYSALQPHLMLFNNVDEFLGAGVFFSFSVCVLFFCFLFWFLFLSSTVLFVRILFHSTNTVLFRCYYYNCCCCCSSCSCHAQLKIMNTKTIYTNMTNAPCWVFLCAAHLLFYLFFGAFSFSTFARYYW